MAEFNFLGGYDYGYNPQNDYASTANDFGYGSNSFSFANVPQQQNVSSVFDSGYNANTYGGLFNPNQGVNMPMQEQGLFQSQVIPAIQQAGSAIGDLYDKYTNSKYSGLLGDLLKAGVTAYGDYRRSEIAEGELERAKAVDDFNRRMMERGIAKEDKASEAADIGFRRSRLGGSYYGV